MSASDPSPLPPSNPTTSSSSSSSSWFASAPLPIPGKSPSSHDHKPAPPHYLAHPHPSGLNIPPSPFIGHQNDIFPIGEPFPLAPDIFAQKHHQNHTPPHSEPASANGSLQAKFGLWSISPKTPNILSATPPTTPPHSRNRSTTLNMTSDPDPFHVHTPGPTTPTSLFSLSSSHGRSLTLPFFVPSLPSSGSTPAAAVETPASVRRSSSLGSNASVKPGAGSLQRNHGSGWSGHGEWMDGRESPTPMAPNSHNHGGIRADKLFPSLTPYSGGSLEPSSSSGLHDLAASTPSLSVSTPMMTAAPDAHRAQHEPPTASSFFGKTSLLSGRLHGSSASKPSGGTDTPAGTPHEWDHGTRNSVGGGGAGKYHHPGSAPGDRLSALKESHNDPARPITPMGNMILTGQFLM